MLRRDAIKLLAVNSIFPSIPAPLFAAFRKVHESLPAASSLKILNPRQDATVTALAELIMPATDTPGAKAARVNEFIDRIVADWYSEAERSQFLAGLADVDARAQKLFSKDFVDAAPDQQAEILRSLGDEMALEAESLVDGPRGYRGSSPEPDSNFYFKFRHLTLTGYFTSEAGFTQQLHQEIIPGRFDGCVSLPPAAQEKGS